MTVYENYDVIAFKSCIQKFTVQAVTSTSLCWKFFEMILRVEIFRLKDQGLKCVSSTLKQDYFFHCSNNILLQKYMSTFWTKFFTLRSIKSRSSFKFITRIDWIKDSPLFLFWWLPRLCNPGYANKFCCCRHSIVIVSPMTNWFSIMPASSANSQWSKMGLKIILILFKSEWFLISSTSKLVIVN